MTQINTQIDTPGLGPETLRPGDIMISTIGGFVPGLLPVAAGQFALAGRERRKTVRDWWHWRHVAMVTRAKESYLFGPDNVGDVQIVQAMPSGAELVSLPASNWTADYLYIRPAYAPGQGCRAASAALDYVGTPYSFVDYLALAWHRLRNGGKIYYPIGERDWLDRYVASSKRMICSQLVDQALTDAGWHTFTDNRLPQDVMPAEFACQLLGMPGEHLRPGATRWTSNMSWPSCCRVPSTHR